MKKILLAAVAAGMSISMVFSSYAGWIKHDSVWYYEMGDGRMATKWNYIDHNWYYFDQRGKMMTGWHEIDGEWYYLRSSGAMAYNQWVGNYYLGSDGAMMTNTWIGPYWVGSDGEWVPEGKGTSYEWEDDFVWVSDLEPVDGKASEAQTREDSLGKEHEYAQIIRLGNGSNWTNYAPTYYLGGDYSVLEAYIAPASSFGTGVVAEFQVLDENEVLEAVTIERLMEPVKLTVDVEDVEFIKFYINRETLKSSDMILYDAKFVK